MSKIFLVIAPLFFLVFAFRSNKHTVTGNIKDENGEVISGASIIEKGTKHGTASDGAGLYSITTGGNNATLVFSAVGHATKEIRIKGRSAINVVLSADQNSLEEVAVTGMAMQDRTVGYFPAQSHVLKSRVAGLQINGYAGYSTSGFNTEDYDGITENGFKKVSHHPLSTFSIDVDAASYSNVRRFLNEGSLPPAGAVRVEEMINYFSYNYPQPAGAHPFSINTEMSDCPWNKEAKLVMIGLQGKKIAVEKLPHSNLVFLIDVSGSMQSDLRLPLVKSSMKLLVDQLREQDNVSIVVYAGAAGLVLPATSGSNKMAIKTAIDALEAGGSTAGGAGIELAYKVANQNFKTGGNNRVILCTDGDFNVGVSSDDAMERLIEKEREAGVYLTVLGYGMGNYKDNKLQNLADKGNGNHAYIDGLAEAKKVLVSEFGGTLFTIAKDVKLQVEFNPAKVAGYRLVGYENRLLNNEDFNDDKKDAGELGSGHTVTALYEVIPAGVNSIYLKEVDPLKYSDPATIKTSSEKDELLTVKFRYKSPEGGKSLLIEQVVANTNKAFDGTSENFRFATAVAGFGMLLRNSEFKGAASYHQVLTIANAAKGVDKEGYRKEFIKLVKKAAVLAKGYAVEEVVIRD